MNWKIFGTVLAMVLVMGVSSHSASAQSRCGMENFLWCKAIGSALNDRSCWCHEEQRRRWERPPERRRWWGRDRDHRRDCNPRRERCHDDDRRR